MIPQPSVPVRRILASTLLLVLPAVLAAQDSLALADTRQISDIVVHPTNPDLVYVAALGHIWAPNPERGVFRSKDGGRTWERILFKNDSTGVVDLIMDPNNSNVLYAGLWQAGRT